jgi:RNA polymerase sigma factor (sigma-70 family)
MSKQVWFRGKPRDELEELYTTHAAQLRRIVAAGVRAPDAVIDDACQIAWSRLIRRRGEVRREATLAWLVTTASREAIRSNGRHERELSLDGLGEQAARIPPVPGPDEVVVQRERLAQVTALPRRQQRLVWLHGLGLNYCEMARYTGDSRRTVERQLLRAKHALRAVA